MESRDRKESKDNTVKFGYAAISSTGKCGMPENHMTAIMNAAKQSDMIIMMRPVSDYAKEFIEEGDASKSFIVKTKSAKKGPGAGFLMMNPQFSHVDHVVTKNLKGELIDSDASYKSGLQKSFDKDKKHDATLVDGGIPLVISEQRIEKLISKSLFSIDEKYSNTTDPTIKKVTWQKEDIMQEEKKEKDGSISITKTSARPITAAAYGKPVEGKPGMVAFFEDEACTLPIKILGKKIKNKENEVEIKPVTADYDLFAALPKWSAVNQELKGDAKAEWEGIYQFASLSELKGEPEKGKLYIQHIPPQAGNNVNSPILKFSVINTSGRTIESVISEKELHNAFNVSSDGKNSSPELEKIISGKDLMTTLNTNTFKILDIVANQGHIESLTKAPIEKRPFRTQGDYEKNKSIVFSEEMKAQEAKKTGEKYEGPKEDELQGNVSKRIQSIINIINKNIEALDPNRIETEGLEMVHHNDESHNPFADILDLPILIFLPPDKKIKLELEGEMDNQPLLVQTISDLKKIREKIQEAGYYWATHARFKEELPAFKEDVVNTVKAGLAGQHQATTESKKTPVNEVTKSTSTIFAGLSISKEVIKEELREKVVEKNSPPVTPEAKTRSIPTLEPQLDKDLENKITMVKARLNELNAHETKKNFKRKVDPNMEHIINRQKALQGAIQSLNKCKTSEELITSLNHLQKTLQEVDSKMKKTSSATKNISILIDKVNKMLEPQLESRFRPR